LARGTNTRATNQANVLDALAAGATYSQAAKHAGVQVSTVANYMQDEDFLQLLQARKASTVTQITLSLTSSCLAAIQVLRDQMANARTDAAVSRAALGILSQANSWLDSDILERLIEMENTIKEQTANNGVVLQLSPVRTTKTAF
jgi:hypothetical protein